MKDNFEDALSAKSSDEVHLLKPASGSWSVPKAAALFAGEYSKDGSDLLITLDGETFRLLGYFTTLDPADIQAENGAVMRGANVLRLAGASQDTRQALLHTEEDQAQLQQVSALDSPIGQVDTLNGTATVIRADGSQVSLATGELIYPNDVVSTETGSTVSLVFVDGTVFTLAQSSRMIIDGLIYDPDGSDNAAVFDLVRGGFVFVAGQIAKTGDMDVNTPTSTIGIRGTTVEVQILVNDDGITEVLVSLLPDWPDGALGQVDLFDVNGVFITTLTDPDVSWVISPIAGETREIARTDAVQLDSEALLTQTYDVTASAELRVEQGGRYLILDGDGAGSGEGAPQVPGAPGGPGVVPQDGAPIQDGQTGPGGQPGAGPEGDQQGEPPQEGGEDDAALDVPGDTQTAFLDDSDLAGITNFADSPAAETAPDLSVEAPPLGEGLARQQGLELGGDPEIGATTAIDPFAGSAFLDPVSVDDQTVTERTVFSSGPLPNQSVPTATDFSAEAGEDGSIAINVLSGATDEDGGPVTLVALGAPSNGVVTLSETGAVIYTPAENFAGTDSFTYTVENAQGNTDTATVTVQIAPVNDAPEVSNDAALTAQSTAIAINVLANDTDVDTPLTDITIVLEDAPTNGTAQIVEGQILYTPQAGFFGIETFTYSVSDGVLNSAQRATVSVTVNDPPVANTDVEAVAEDQSVLLDVLNNDVDTENDPFSLSVVSAPANGTAVITAGQVAYTPIPDFNGTDSFSYTVIDQNGAISTATVNVTVNPVNDAPVAVPQVSADVIEDGAVEIAPLLGASDVDGDALTLSAIVSEPNNGTLSQLGNVLTYTPNADFSGTDSFTYEIRDAGNATDTGTVTITVAPVNDVPVVNDLGGVSVAEDGSITLDLLAQIQDVDGDPITVAPGAAQNGTVSFDGTNYVYTPNADFSGTDSFGFTADDGQGGIDSGAVTITVTAVNDAPAAVDDVALTSEGTAVTFAVLGNDTDIDGDDLDVTSVTQGANGSVTIEADGRLTYTPDSDFNGNDSFSYTVADPSGATSTATVDVTVGPVNDAPIARDDLEVATVEDTSLLVDVLANDTDPEDDALSVQSVSDAQNGATRIDENGDIVYT
ncbi:MAG: tandem-95 repeat protein, partial [Paracoccaceae bacterium]